MKSIIASLILTLFVTSIAFASQEECKAFVLVSINPHKYFVERIAGERVAVGVMVPPGANAHTFEPTPRQVMRFSCANIWFLIGEGFEKKSAPAMRAHHPEIELVDLRQGIEMIHDSHHHHQCTHHDCADPHTWLSLRTSKQQVQTMISALSAKYPQYATEFQKNGATLIRDLEELDSEITEMLAPVKGRAFIVSHPAYAYFARDYGMEQLSIEFEGKDPSPQQLTRVIRQAKQKQIATIFIQVQFNNKGARLVAQHLGANVVTLDPYAENYLENMRETARGFSNP